MTESDAERKIVRDCDAANFAAVDIPKSDAAVAPACNEAAIVAVVDAQSAGTMSAPAFELFAFLHFPKFDSAVFAGRGEKLGIATPTQRRNGRFVPCQGEKF